ncbi:MAG: 3-deoxy-manno-octulosonate cytidylyltransferase [Gemmatimonadales bacterium]
MIPARLGSTRLPHKPLCLFAGEPLVRVTARRALSLRLADRVVVATDDERVAAAVAPAGVEAVLTDPRHRSGTDRVAEVAQLEPYAGYATILNLQGDEPLMPRAAVRGALDRVWGGDAVGTAAAPLAPEARFDTARVKVVVDETGRALRFSRVYPASGAWACGVEVLQHIGVYAYTRQALVRWAAAPPSAGEAAEGLEQLRPLELGFPVGVARLAHAAPPAIDTERDLADAEALVHHQNRRAV